MTRPAAGFPAAEHAIWILILEVALDWESAQNPIHAHSFCELARNSHW